MYDYNKLLNNFKLRNAIPDDIQDDLITEYLKSSMIYIGSQIMLIPLVNNKLPDSFFDEICPAIEIATMHQASILWNNPDTNIEATNVVDKRQLYRILGSLVNYGL